MGRHLLTLISTLFPNLHLSLNRLVSLGGGRSLTPSHSLLLQAGMELPRASPGRERMNS